MNLYRELYKALRSNGILLTSFLTPPPSSHSAGDWQLNEINQEDLFLEKIIIFDILDAKWIKFRNENLVIAQLEEAGFTILDIFYDRAHIIPIIVAKK